MCGLGGVRVLRGLGFRVARVQGLWVLLRRLRMYMGSGIGWESGFRVTPSPKPLDQKPLNP